MAPEAAQARHLVAQSLPESICLLLLTGMRSVSLPAKLCISDAAVRAVYPVSFLYTAVLWQYMGLPCISVSHTRYVCTCCLQAATLAGCKLLLALCDREAAPRSRDEFFITDLVGLKAVDADTQQLIGIVTEVYDSSASYSLLRVRLAPNEQDIAQSKYRSVLVPFVSEIVPDVDVQGGLMEVTLPEGLMETASSKKLRRPYTTEQQAQLRQQLKQRQQQQIQQQQQQEPQ